MASNPVTPDKSTLGDYSYENRPLTHWKDWWDRPSLIFVLRCGPQDHDLLVTDAKTHASLARLQPTVVPPSG